MDDVENVLFRALELNRQAQLADSSSSVNGPDLENLFFRQNVIGDRFPMSGYVPALSVSVIIVVGNGSQKQMVRPDAWRVVAFVKHAQSIRYRSIIENPACPMCQDHKRRWVAGIEPTMSKSFLMARPQPTANSGRVDVNAGPEPFLKRGRQSLRFEVLGANVDSCGVHHMSSCRSRAVTGRAETLFYNNRRR